MTTNLENYSVKELKTALAAAEAREENKELARLHQVVNELELFLTDKKVMLVYNEYKEGFYLQSTCFRHHIVPLLGIE